MSERRGALRARGPQPPSSDHGGDELAAVEIGEYLKRQRILRGITIEELAASTRIPLRSLERLEAGYFDGVTDGFVRGFVRTVAIALGIDPDQTVARMLAEPVGGKWDRDGAGLGRKQALAVAALGLVVLLAFFGLRAGWRLLAGDRSGATGRERVVWRDPIHQLAVDHAEGRFVVTPPPREPDSDPPAEFPIEPDAGSASVPAFEAPLELGTGVPEIRP